MEIKNKKKIIRFDLQLDVDEAKALQHVLREAIENEKIRKKLPNEIIIAEQINSLLYCNIID